MTVLDTEQRAVRRAQQTLAVSLEKAVGKRVERRAEVRAGIGVGVEGAAVLDDEERIELVAAPETKAAAAPLGNVLDAAKAARRHTSTPPILHRMRHSAAPTGTTDSRDCRTSARSASGFSALICASVTGVFTAASGFTST